MRLLEGDRAFFDERLKAIVILGQLVLDILELGDIFDNEYGAGDFFSMPDRRAFDIVIGACSPCCSREKHLFCVK
ncbi:MAG: hypothetical protein ACD_74C00241G0002 [uncultured bacterium]|nr:MAG: hypothetical protein ACD_74C00241G0002 [uncultured bacterium]